MECTLYTSVLIPVLSCVVYLGAPGMEVLGVAMHDAHVLLWLRTCVLSVRCADSQGYEACLHLLPGTLLVDTSTI